MVCYENTYSKEDEYGNRSRHTDDESMRLVEALRFVAKVLDETSHPGKGVQRAALDSFGCALLEDEDGEKDDIAENDHDDDHAAPLKLDHSSHALVRLPGRFCGGSGKVQGRVGAFYVGAILSEKGHIDLDAVT